MSSDDFLLHRLCATSTTTLNRIQSIVSEHPRSRRIIDAKGWLPLHHALSLGKQSSFDIVEYLLEIYEDGSKKTVEHGRTCLHLAVLSHCSSFIVAMLLNVWPDGNLVKTKILEQTPLHYSVRYGSTIDTVRMLTDANRELLTDEDGSGRLPLHVALRNRCSQDVINWILKKNPTATTHSDKCGYYPAAVAVLAGSRLPALRLVLDTWGGALLEVTRDGDSLMHTACRASSPPILKYLLHIGISTNILNHKGMKPHQCLPKRPRKSNPKKSILGVDRTTIMNCLVQITKARRSWNPQTHQLFPPEFRSVSKMLAMYSLRLERKLVVHYRENNPAYLRLPFQRILKFLDRNWFDNDQKTQQLRKLQPHLQLGHYGQIPVFDSSKKSVLDIFANRRKRNKLIYKIRKMSQSMNVDIIRIATKRVVVGMSAKDDNTDIVLAKMNAIRKANQAKIDRAKRNARLRKEQALLKKMAAFFREKDDGSNFVHPLDLMNKEVEMEEERIEMVENGLLPSDAKVLGKPWYDFLGGSRNIGVNELFYEQLLRENVRMEKEFMRDVNVLHEFDNENMMLSDALNDAEYQLEQDNEDIELHFNTVVKEYYEEVEEEKYQKEEKKKDFEWENFVQRAGGLGTFDFVDSIESLGSVEMVQKHEAQKQQKIEQREEHLQKAWNGIDSEMSEEEVLLRMLGMVGDSEWNDEFDIDGIGEWMDEDYENESVDSWGETDDESEDEREGRGGRKK